VRPDVVITYVDRLLLVEIALTHKVEQSKLARLRELGHAAVAIDLSRQRPATVGELAVVLFRNDPRKKWLVNRKQDELRARLEAQCDADYQKHLEETRAFEARVAARRSTGDRASSERYIAESLIFRFDATMADYPCGHLADSGNGVQECMAVRCDAR